MTLSECDVGAVFLCVVVSPGEDEGGRHVYN